MKYYKLDGLVYAFEGDGSQDKYIPAGAILMNENEVEAHLSASIKTPTLEDKFESVRIALQASVDVKAREFGFSGGNSLILYAGFQNQFQQQAQQFAAWEVSVWVEAEIYKQEVIAGTKPMLTPEQAVSMMPDYQ